MTEYARVENGVIVSLMPEPTDVVAIDGRWWDFRDPGIRFEWLTAHGWSEVVEVERPADTDAGTFERVVQVVDGIPVAGWVLRAWTPAELAERAAAGVELGLLQAAVADNPRLLAGIEALRIILGDAATPGSVRAWRATVTNQYNAGVLRNLGDLVIDVAQQQRMTERQVLRLAKIVGRDLGSGDVG